MVHQSLECFPGGNKVAKIFDHLSQFLLGRTSWQSITNNAQILRHRTNLVTIAQHCIFIK